jgi:hypothetical protein
MNSLFHELDNSGEYTTSVRNILAAVRFFRMQPDGRVTTGIWDEPNWSRETFREWFRKRLHEKINVRGYQSRNRARRVRAFWGDRRFGRRMTDDYTSAIAHDARVINDYVGKRIRSTGSSGLLRTPEMQKRYPHINCQREER